MTDASTKEIKQTLTIARDNGHAIAEPIHLATVLFSDDDSIGSHVVAKVESKETKTQWTYDRYVRQSRGSS